MPRGWTRRIAAGSSRPGSSRPGSSGPTKSHARRRGGVRSDRICSAWLVWIVHGAKQRAASRTEIVRPSGIPLTPVACRPRLRSPRTPWRPADRATSAGWRSAGKALIEGHSVVVLGVHHESQNGGIGRGRPPRRVGAAHPFGVHPVPEPSHTSGSDHTATKEAPPLPADGGIRLPRNSGRFIVLAHVRLRRDSELPGAPAPAPCR